MIKQWDLTKSRCISTIVTEESAIPHMCVCPNEILYYSCENSVCLWDIGLRLRDVVFKGKYPKFPNNLSPLIIAPFVKTRKIFFQKINFFPNHFRIFFFIQKILCCPQKVTKCCCSKKKKEKFFREKKIALFFT